MGLTIQEINLVRAHLEKNDNAFLTDLQALETFTRNPAAYRLCIGKDGHLWNQDIHVDVLTRIFHCFQRFFLEKSFNSEEERKEFLLAKGKADANLALWLGREANLKVEIKETDELPVQLRKAREIGEIAWEKLKQNPPFFVPRSEPLANVEKVKSVQPIESDSERLQRKMNRLVEEAMRCLFVDPQRFQQIITEVSQQYLSFGSEDQVVERRVCIDFFRDLWRKLEWEINKNPHNRDLKIKMLAFCVCAESLLDELNATEKNEEISQLSRHFRLRRGEILDIMNKPIPLSIADPALYLITPTTLNAQLIGQLAKESLSAERINMNELKKLLYLVMNVHITTKNEAEKKRASSIMKQIIEVVMKTPEGPGMLEDLKIGALRSIENQQQKRDFFVLFRTIICPYKKDLKSLDQSIWRILQSPSSPRRKRVACAIA